MAAPVANTKTAARPVGRGMVPMPPFWELEGLLAQGHGLEQALAIMIARRAGTADAPSAQLPRAAWAPRRDDAAPTQAALSA